MNSSIRTETTVTLNLTHKEALWLKAYMQNPHCEPHKENEEDNSMRCLFFNSIPNSL